MVSSKTHEDCLAQQDDTLVTLPNITKAKKDARPKNKTLEKAVENKDLGVIQDFLLSDRESIANLSKFYKTRLLPLLLEFLDQPQRIEAITCIYELLNDVGNAEVFSKVLAQRAVDFNKLVYLKGKIDYLKYLQNTASSENIENEYEEEKL